MNATKTPLKQLQHIARIFRKQVFEDTNYAWELLQAEVKLETSEAQNILGEDISNLLTLYMRGVEKMNTLMDIRQSFFKNRVTSLMSRPAIIKILNRPMNKKGSSSVATYEASPKLQKKGNKQENSNSESPRRLDVQKQLQLKQKKQSLQMRLAYSAEQNNPDALKKMMAAHSQKQIFLTQKIDKIVDSHQDKLRKRISERKQRMLTVKAKSEINHQIQSNEITVGGFVHFQSPLKDSEHTKMINSQRMTNQIKNLQHKKAINESQNQSNQSKEKNKKINKFSKHRSLSPRRLKIEQESQNIIEGPTQRKISQDLSKETQVTKEQVIEFLKTYKNKIQITDQSNKTR